MRISIVVGPFLAFAMSSCAADHRLPAPRPPSPAAPAVPAATPARVTPPSLRLPPLVVAAPGATLHAPGHSDVVLARPRTGLPLTVDEVSEDGREVRVRIAGPLEVRGVVRRDALGVVVCEAGPVGERLYAGAHNLLLLRSGEVDGGVKVAGTAVVRVREHAPDVPHGSQFQRLTYEGTIATSRLCATPPPKRHAGTKDDPVRAHPLGEVDIEDFPPGTPLVPVRGDAALTLLAAPGGAPVFTRAASRWSYELALLRREGAFCLVAAGSGPYVLGWVPAEALGEPRPAQTHGGLAAIGGVLRSPGALHARKLAALPLHTLAAGTELRAFGVVHARFTRDGLARVVAKKDGAAYVVAAVDDDVTVEGWLDEGRLGPVVASGASPSSPPSVSPVRPAARANADKRRRAPGRAIRQCVALRRAPASACATRRRAAE